MGSKARSVPEWGSDGPWPREGDNARYLYVYTTASQGFGDKVRWHYDTLALAMLAKRTLITPTRTCQFHALVAASTPAQIRRDHAHTGQPRRDPRPGEV